MYGSKQNVEEIIMNKNKLGIVVFLVALAFMMGPASAAQVDVDPTMTNDEIQGYIDDAAAGDTINFQNTGTAYTGISLTINKALNMVGNGATIIGNGSAVMTITGTTGLNITGFNININSNAASCIYGSNVISCKIENNNITNGGDAINIFQLYKDLTINNNHITNMVNKHGDAISIVNHDANLETATTSRITNNVIDNAIYGIFLGGNFNGTVSGNSITNTQYGMNITGKHTANLGSLNAVISNNNITGIAMENPNVVYLNMNNNIIGQLSTSGYSVLTNSYFAKNSTGTISVTNNVFNYPVTTAFRNSANTWTGNNI
jgi:hypothetical protein